MQKDSHWISATGAGPLALFLLTGRTDGGRGTESKPAAPAPGPEIHRGNSAGSKTLGAGDGGFAIQ